MQNKLQSPTQLLVESLEKHYKKRSVVRKVSLNIQAGEIVGLLGANGAGKTTTFYMIAGLITPDSGKITLDRKEITHFPLYRRAKMGIGYLPQERSVFQKMTVRNNLLAVLELTHLKRKEREARADTLLAEFQLTKLSTTLALQLSGGETRRLEIARALATEPTFILFDEPFAGIDPLSILEIRDIMQKLVKKNIGILITDHNVRETLSICHKAYIMQEGTIIAQGDPDMITKSPLVRKVYLGDNFSLR